LMIIPFDFIVIPQIDYARMHMQDDVSLTKGSSDDVQFSCCASLI